MVQITINPESARARTTALKEGENTVGRAEDNDIPVSEDGVSGHHCRITVAGGAVSITDLNSTNGTHFNGSRIHQSEWAPGQIIYLGTTPVRLEPSAGNGTPNPAAVPAGLAQPSAGPALRIATPAAPGKPGPIQVRLRTATPASAAPAPETSSAESRASEAVADEAESAPASASAPAFVTAPAGTRCRSHAQVPANWTCPNCHKYFCDLCVSTRATSSGAAHTCRSCGVECSRVYVEASAEVAERGFFARLPGAFLFPFRGIGVLILIIATIIFEGSAMLGGMFAILLKMMIAGYLFVFMQDIIHGAAVGEEKMPGLPEFDGLFVAFFKMAATVAISFCVPIGLMIARFSDVDIPAMAILVSTIVSMLYFPMAFLAVAVVDSVAAANPMVVVPSILRVPGQYIVCVVLLEGVYGLQGLAKELGRDASADTFTTTEMSVLLLSLAGRALWSFLSVYLLAVASRILGLLYVTQKEKLGWL